MDGALIIDKPAGVTSHDVVARVRKIIGERRIGHTGTLDPFATGVLVLLLGKATRLAQFLSGAQKEYEAVVRLGYATDTGDVTGTPLKTLTTEALRHTEIHREEIEAALGSLRGEIDQVPPMYSAKKVGGRKLYELARQGEEIERKAVRVVINEFIVIDPNGSFLKENEDGSRDLRVRVVCSAGTYIRTLAEDLGKKLDTAAHLAELRRTRAGRFRIEGAMTLEQLADSNASNSFGGALIPPHQALAHLPSIEVEAEDERRTLHGLDLGIESGETMSWSDGEMVRISRDGKLVAIGKYDLTRKLIHPTVVIGND